MTDRTGRITTVAQDYEVRLAQQEARALLSMQAGYTAIVSDLKNELTALENKIVATFDAGEPVPVSWLHRDARYRALMRDAQSSFVTYGGNVSDMLALSQESAIGLARRGSIAMLQSQLGTVPDTQRLVDSLSMLPDEAIRQLTGTIQSGPLSELLNTFGTDAAETIGTTLTTGLAKGLHPSQVTKLVVQKTNVIATRAALITRTELYRSFREANRSTFLANANVVDEWVWNAHLGGHTCAACLAMHGTVHPLTEPMGSHPGCRCTMLPRTKSWEDLGFKGIPETRLDPSELGDAESWLLQQPPQGQVDAFGGNKKLWRGWQDGEITLKDAVRTVHTPDWGTTRTIPGYDLAVANAKARQAEFNRIRELDEQAKLKKTTVKRAAVKGTWDEKVRALTENGITSEAHAREVGKLIHDGLASDLEKITADRQSTQLQLDVYRRQRDRLSKGRADFRDSDEYRSMRIADRANAVAEKFTKRIDELDAKITASYKKLEKLHTGSVYRKGLQKVRPGFGKGTGEFGEVVGSTKGNIKLLNARKENFPAEWWDDMTVTNVRSKHVDRGVFSAKNHQDFRFVDVNLSGLKGSETLRATATHELAHFSEWARPRLTTLEKEFYQRRTAGETLEWIGPGYNPSEISRKDAFVDPYIGKDYQGHFYEVLSMGMESVFHPAHWGDVQNDLDMLHFILGVLAVE